MSDAAWYYSNDGQRIGPVSLGELRRLTARGRIRPDELIWCEGWADWRPASDVQELKDDSAISDPGPKTPYEANHGISVRPDPPAHFLDILLDALRALFPQADFAETARLMAEFGRYSLYAAMLIWAVHFGIWAIKVDSLNLLFIGIGGSLGGLALQYSGVRLSQALPRLIRSIPTRISSTAFFDSLAVFFLIGGVVGLVALTLMSIRFESPGLLCVGVVLFFGLEQLALYALRPEAMNIRVAEDASGGEEAIAIISFFFLLPLRSVPLIFGVGTAVGAVGLLACLLLTLRGGESATMAADYTEIAGAVTLGTAALPLLAYVYFIFNYLSVDLIRSILIIPSKLDGLSGGRQNPGDSPSAGG